MPHCRLFIKLAADGIRGKPPGLDKIIPDKSTTEGCIQRCLFRVVPGYIVEFPSGSVLGPLLFNIYVNDIPSVVNSETLMFADDTKIFRKIQSQSDFSPILARH